MATTTSSGRAARTTAWLMGGMVMAMAAGGSGCQSGRTAITSPSDTYQNALAYSGTRAVAFTPGSEVERVALDRVTAFFTDFSESNVTARVRGVYAPDAYLRDGFKELQGVEAIAPYMIRSTDPLRRCTFVFEQITANGPEYYLRWVMRVNLKRDPEDREDAVIGMSHIRFDAEGQVIFQQDYWDPSDVLYSRIPIAGWLINTVKARL